MIKQMNLSNNQLRWLGHRVSDWLEQQGIPTSGLEVTHVQDEGDVMKAFFVYEGCDGRDHCDSTYFTAHLGHKEVTDFVAKVVDQ